MFTIFSSITGKGLGADKIVSKSDYKIKHRNKWAILLGAWHYGVDTFSEGIEAVQGELVSAEQRSSSRLTR